MSVFDGAGLWPAQVKAIRGLERSFYDGEPRALIQMATGSGKSRTAVSSIYRLVREAKASRVLFLVDRGNLGRLSPPRSKDQPELPVLLLGCEASELLRQDEADLPYGESLLHGWGGELSDPRLAPDLPGRLAGGLGNALDGIQLANMTIWSGLLECDRPTVTAALHRVRRLIKREQPGDGGRLFRQAAPPQVLLQRQPLGRGVVHSDDLGLDVGPAELSGGLDAAVSRHHLPLTVSPGAHHDVLELRRASLEGLDQVVHVIAGDEPTGVRSWTQGAHR